MAGFVFVAGPEVQSTSIWLDKKGVQAFDVDDSFGVSLYLLDHVADIVAQTFRTSQKQQSRPRLNTFTKRLPTQSDTPRAYGAPLWQPF